MRLAPWACALVAVATFACGAHANKLPRQVVGNGATLASGSGKRIAGTVGQVAVGPVTASGKKISQGFWYARQATVVASDPVLPTRVELGAAEPNPASGAVSFSLVLPEDAKVDLVVLDIKGRVVFRSPMTALAAGSHRLALDFAGRPGVYYARLLLNGKVSETRHFVRVE